MTQDEIIRMAEEAGSHEYGPLTRNWSFELSQLERFAALVIENAFAQHMLEANQALIDLAKTAEKAVLAERESCANICDKISFIGLNTDVETNVTVIKTAAFLADEIRSRNKK